jgi:RNA polymerase sigma-32 factor
MSKITVALEAAVATVVENTPQGDVRQTARQRANADKAFAVILKLIAPRIRHFIRQYGLVGHWDDAEQCCAIGVHRAIQAYQPEKAQFTTFVNWQLRGELQSLRFRVMTDQRPSAKKVEATTVSLHAIATGPDGDESSLEAMIVDEEALSSTEAGASAYLTQGARTALIDQYVAHLRATGVEQLKRKARAKRAPAQEMDGSRPRFRLNTIDPAELAELDATIAEHRAVAERRLFDDATLDELETETGIAKERVRQIAKRAAKTIGDLAANEPRFAMMAASKIDLPARPRKAKAAVAALLPTVSATHNMLAQVQVVEVTEEAADQFLAEANGYLADLDHAGTPVLH